MVLPAREEIDHTAGRPQSWADADEDVRDWVGAITARLRRSDAVGVFLHGSLATASFHRPKSDVDVLAVVEDPLGEAERRALAVDLLELHGSRPILGGLELSVVRRALLAPFTHPIPYELHFSEKWVDDVRGGGIGPVGTDPDLAAHCTMTRQQGLALVGPAPDHVIDEIPHEMYLDAVLDDATWILDGGIFESPVYGVLNLCRTLQLVVDDPGQAASKVEGAIWALNTLPVEHHPAIVAALEFHRSRAEIPAELRRVHGHRWAEEPLRRFSAHARDVLRPRI